MEEAVNFASKMKKLRIKKKVSLEELAQKTGYSLDYLAKIESNEATAPVSVILSVSSALSIASEDFLLLREEKSSRRKELKQRRQSFEKRTENYSYEVLTPHGKHKHLNAFKVTIEPRQEHKLAEYHHPGEEFVYILSGILELKVGKITYTLNPGESRHFDSSKIHILKSISKEPTIVLVTIYSP
jgi:quercetin dioxygenase-like cupin family protein